jgi:integrase/recombinase XerD
LTFSWLKFIICLIFLLKQKKEADINPNHLSVLNPNYFHGCHPFDLRSYFESDLFFENLDAAFPLNLVSEDAPPPKLPLRQQVLERLLKNITAHDLVGKVLVEQYLRDQYRRNCRPNTLRQAATSLTQFLTFYRKLGKTHLEQIKRQDIEAFVEHEQDRGLKPDSVRTRLCGVYAFVRFLIENKIVGYELMERKLKLKLADRLPRAMDAQDLSRLLCVIDNIRDRALILLLLRTGMRIGELLNTNVDDVDLRQQKIIIYLSDKTSVGRVVYYSEDAQQALLAWLKMRDPFKDRLFYGQGKASQSLGYGAARMIFIKYLQKADLAYSGYTLHCLRHSYATELLNARMPLECLRVLLGHTNLEVTRRYARLSDKTRKEQYFSAMDNILKGEADADD